MIFVEIITFSAVGINLLFSLVQLFRWRKHQKHRVLFLLFLCLALVQLDLSLYATRKFHLVPYFYCLNMPFIALMGPLLLWYMRILRSNENHRLPWFHFVFPGVSALLYLPWILMSKEEKVRYIQHEYNSASSIDTSLDLVTLLVLTFFIAYVIIIFFENHRASKNYQRLSLLWILLIAVNALVVLGAIAFRQLFLFHLAEILLPVSLLAFLALTQFYPQLIHLPTTEDPYLWLRSEGREMRVKLADIKYVQANRNQCVVHTTNGHHAANASLKELLAKLQGKDFFRSHKSFLVNLQFLSHIRHDQNGNYLAYLNDEDDSIIPVSRKNAGAIRQYLKNH